MAKKPTREKVLAYLDGPGKDNACATSRHFRGKVSPALVRYYRNARRKRREKDEKGPGSGGAARPKSSKHASRGGTPAQDLGDDDRERALRIVRSADEVIELALAAAKARILGVAQAIATDPTVKVPPLFDEREARAAQAWGRTAKDMVERHPGLLKLARDPAPPAHAADSQLDRLRDALESKETTDAPDDLPDASPHQAVPQGSQEGAPEAPEEGQREAVHASPAKDQGPRPPDDST